MCHPYRATTFQGISFNLCVVQQFAQSLHLEKLFALCTLHFKPCAESAKMNSCEPSRTAAYGLDIRWRMVYQRVYLELSFKAISQNLCVDVSTVRRTLDLFMLTGDVTKRPYPEQHGCKLRRLTEDDQLFILNLVLERPGIYLHELKHELLVSKQARLLFVDFSTHVHSQEPGLEVLHYREMKNKEPSMLLR